MIQQPTLGPGEPFPLAWDGTWDRRGNAREDRNRSGAKFRPRTTLGGGFRGSLATIWATLKRIAAAPVITRIRRRAVTAADIRASKVLEVGVGHGRGLARYDRSNAVTGTEANYDAISAARREIVRHNLDHVTGLYRAPPHHLRFADASFDTVSAFFLFTRRQRPSRIVSELVRVTRPGGRILVVNRFGRGITRESEQTKVAPSTSSPVAPRTDAGGSLSRLRAIFGRRTQTPPHLLLRRDDLAFVRQRVIGPLGLVSVFEFAKCTTD